MTFECLSYGNNVSQKIYDTFHGWYNNQSCEGCCGCLETTGKVFLLAPAHLLTGLILTPILMIYDLVMTLFFTLANLFTAFLFRELRDRWVGHTTSIVLLFNQARMHFVTAFAIPCVYRGGEVIASHAASHNGW